MKRYYFINSILHFFQSYSLQMHRDLIWCFTSTENIFSFVNGMFFVLVELLLHLMQVPFC